MLAKRLASMGKRAFGGGVRYGSKAAVSRRSAIVKSFGRRQAYKSPEARTSGKRVIAYGDFGFRPIRARSRPLILRARSGGVGRRKRAENRSWRALRRAYRLRLPLSAMAGVSAIVRRGMIAAAGESVRPCRVTRRRSRLEPAVAAAHGVGFSVRTPRQ